MTEHVKLGRLDVRVLIHIQVQETYSIAARMGSLLLRRTILAVKCISMDVRSNFVLAINYNIQTELNPGWNHIHLNGQPLYEKKKN